MAHVGHPLLDFRDPSPERGHFRDPWGDPPAPDEPVEVLQPEGTLGMAVWGGTYWWLMDGAESRDIRPIGWRRISGAPGSRPPICAD